MQHQLDSQFIKSLVIPFNEVLPSGALKDLRDEFNVSETTPRKVLTGEWTNDPLARSALSIVVAHTDLCVRFLKQFPKQLVDELYEEIAQSQTT